MNSSRTMRSAAKQILSVIIILGYSGLSPHAAAAKPVIIVVGDQSLEGCEPLGKVKGSSNPDGSADDNIPYVDRLIKARNHLKEETQKLGADTVHIINSNTSGRYEVPGVSKEIIHIGNAYRCE